MLNMHYPQNINVVSSYTFFVLFAEKQTKNKGISFHRYTLNISYIIRNIQVVNIYNGFLFQRREHYNYNTHTLYSVLNEWEANYVMNFVKYKTAIKVKNSRMNIVIIYILCTKISNTLKKFRIITHTSNCILREAILV